MFRNARRISNKKEELQRVLQDYDVLIIFKTWLKGNITFEFVNFNTYSLPSMDGPGGTLAFIVQHCTLHFSTVDIIDEIIGA